MKHFSLVLGIAMLLCGSCNNADTSQNPSQNAADTKEVAGNSMESPDKIAGKAKSTLAEIDLLLKQLNEMPAKIKQKKAAEIEPIQLELSGIQEKQRNLIVEFNQAVGDHAGSKTQQDAATSTDQQNQPGFDVAVYTQQFDEYAKNVEDIKERVKKLTD